MKNRKRVIWSNMDSLNADDWRGEYEDHLDISDLDGDASNDAEVLDWAYEMNSIYLDDERANLNIPVAGDIVAIGDIGTWRGVFKGHKMIGANISDCLYSDCDRVEWYVDLYGNMRATAIHHDGRNHYLYRQIRPTLSDEQLNNFLDKAYLGKLSKTDITRYTTRLGDLIGDVYGWRFAGRRPA